MDRALLLLLRYRAKGSLRLMFRQLRTIKGALLVGFASIFLAAMIVPVIVRSFVTRDVTASEIVNGYLSAGVPLALASYTILSILSSFGERSIYFRPAEVDFLFPAPFSRRQLLLYSITSQVLTAVFVGALMATSCSTFLPWWFASFWAISLGFLFVNGLVLCVQLFAETISEAAFTRGRKVLLAVIVALVALAAVQVVVTKDNPTSWSEFFHQLRVAPTGRVLLFAFDAFGKIVVAPRLVPDLIGWVAVGLVLNVVVFAIVLRLDANFLETSVRVSQAMQERLKGMARGGIFQPRRSKTKTRSRLSRTPWWLGIGPIAFRQLVLIVSVSRTFVVLSAVVGAGGTLAAFGLVKKNPAAITMIPIVVAGAMAYLTLIASAQGPWGFRGDLDHMDSLKSLPIHPWAIALGQVVPIVVLFTAVDLLVFAAAAIVVGGNRLVWLQLCCFALPWNGLMFAIENLFFLHFPLRITPGTVDLAAIGQVLIMMALKVVCLLLAFGLAVGAGSLTFLVLANWIVACLIGWLVLMTIVGGLMAFVGEGFRSYDVARSDS